MGIENLLSRLQNKSVTPVTPRNPSGVTREQASIQAVTPVTPVTPQKTIAELENENRGKIIGRLEGFAQDEPEGAAAISKGEMSTRGEIVQPGASNEELSDHAEELRTERAAIQEFDGGLARDIAEARATLSYPCTCKSKRFWVSAHGPVRCGVCHPPADPKAVVRWVELP